MADVATPSAAQVATADASAPEGKQQHVRPEKPDEETYKEDLAKAEKVHSAAQEKYVSYPLFSMFRYPPVPHLHSQYQLHPHEKADPGLLHLVSAGSRQDF